MGKPDAYSLALDFGTGGVKSALVGSDAAVYASDVEEYADFPRRVYTGTAAGGLDKLNGKGSHKAARSVGRKAAGDFGCRGVGAQPRRRPRSGGGKLLSERTPIWVGFARPARKAAEFFARVPYEEW